MLNSYSYTSSNNLTTSLKALHHCCPLASATVNDNI